MRLSTLIKRKYSDQGVKVMRAIQDNAMVRLTVPANTPTLKDEVKRDSAGLMLGGRSDTLAWVWVWSGSPEWVDNVVRCE